MDWKKNKHYLLVSDSCYRDILIDARSQNPEVDIKIVSRDEAISMLAFSYAKDPLPFLLAKEKYSYTDLKSLLPVLCAGGLPVGGELFELHKELIKNDFLKEDKIGKYQLKKNKVLLFEDDEDMELKYLLKKEGILYEEIHFSDIGFSKKYEEHPEIYLFPDKIHQFSYLFADLRKKIVQEGKDATGFEILAHDSQDRYFVDLLSSIFGIPAFFEYQYPLLSDENVRKAMEGFRRDKRILLENPETDSLRRLKELIDHYCLGNPEMHFDYAFANLMEIVKSESILDSVDGGIKATTRMDFSSHRTYYVTNFQYGDFYKVASDKGLLSDAELLAYHVNPSYVRTKLDKRKKANFFRYMDVVFFSRVELHLSDKIFPSQLLFEIPSEEKKPPFREIKKEVFLDGLYTTRAKEFTQSLLKDKNFLAPDETFRSYDNRYTTVKDLPLENTYSTTGFKNYYACPFKYYLDQVVRLSDKDPEQDYFSRKFGDFVHFIFEKIYDKDFDFDVVFSKAKEAFLKESAEKECKATNERELALLENSKEYIRRFVANVEQQKKFASIRQEEAEKPFRIDLHSKKSGRNYTVKGRIDKVLYTGKDSSADGKGFYAIIDYKTGNESFDYRTVFLGNSLQLPLYYLGMQTQFAEMYGDQMEEKAPVFGMFGIQKNFKKGPLKDDKENSYNAAAVSKYMKVRGVVLFDKDFLFTLEDKNVVKKDGEVSSVDGNYLSKSLTFRKDKDTGLKKGLPYSFEDVIDDARKAAVEIMDRTQEGEFPIAPVTVKTGGEVSCNYCPYRDICFRKTEDIRNVADEIKAHLGSFGTDDEEEEEA